MADSIPRTWRDRLFSWPWTPWRSTRLDRRAAPRGTRTPYIEPDKPWPRVGSNPPPLFARPPPPPGPPPVRRVVGHVPPRALPPCNPDVDRLGFLDASGYVPITILLGDVVNIALGTEDIVAPENDS